MNWLSTKAMAWFAIVMWAGLALHSSGGKLAYAVFMLALLSAALGYQYGMESRDKYPPAGN